MPAELWGWAQAHPRVLLGVAMAAWAAYEFRSTAGHALRGRRDQLWWTVKYLLVVAGGFLVGRRVVAPVWADLMGVLP